MKPARELRYREAIDEATRQAMAKDERIVVLGVGVDDAKGIFGTTRGAFEQFGSARVFDTPLSEAALTGICVGAAMRGLHPVLVHARNDFLLLTMDQIVNNAAKWRYMSGGKLHVPFTIRAIIGRGWGQAAQHSQSLQVIMPATPGDAKGLLMTAYSTDSPVLCLEHRWLYETSGPVPEEPYYLPIGTATVVREGSDVTIVAVSHMVVEALQAAEILAAAGIEAEIVDPRSLRPLDSDLICRSVAKTGRLVIADTGWRSYGVSGEIASRVGEELFGRLKAPIRRIALPDVPTPGSQKLEQVYYPGSSQLAAAVRQVVEGQGSSETDGRSRPRGATEFEGPF